jgi:hypothetical protein
VFEQVADERHAPQERHLVDGGVLIADDHAANDHGSAIIDENLGLSRLGIQARLAVHADRLVNLSILDADVQENRALRSDLRSHFQFQDGIDVLRGNGVVDVGLDRDLLALLHGQLVVVLGDAFWFRQYFADSAALHHAKQKVDGVVVALRGKGEAAVRGGGAKICIERNLAGPVSAGCKRGIYRVDDRTQKSRESGQTAEGRVPRDAGGSGEAEFRADLAGKGAGSLHDAGFNFHLLRLPVDLAQ